MTHCEANMLSIICQTPWQASKQNVQQSELAQACRDVPSYVPSIHDSASALVAPRSRTLVLSMLLWGRCTPLCQPQTILAAPPKSPVPGSQQQLPWPTYRSRQPVFKTQPFSIPHATVLSPLNDSYISTSATRSMSCQVGICC